MQWKWAFIYQRMLPSLIHGDRAKLSYCNEVSVQVSVPAEVCKKHLSLCANAPIRPLLSCDVLLSSQVHGSAPAFLLSLSLSLLFFLHFSFSIFISFPLALLCFHAILLSHCTPWHPGEQWFSNNLCSKPVDLMIEQCKSENNTKGQFSIGQAQVCWYPGPFAFIMQAMLRMT